MQTIIAICMLHTSLRRVRKPTYPDFKHHIHRGCIQASRSGSSFLHPDFCGTGAFGAGLITLDGPMPTFLYHVCLQAPNLQQQWGGLQSSLKIEIKHCQPRVVKKWGFWGGANRTSSTQARLPRPCFLDQPQKSPATMGRLAIEPQDRNQTLSNPVLCDSGAFAAGLTTLARFMPTFLYHVCLQAPNISSNNGAACSRASR